MKREGLYRGYSYMSIEGRGVCIRGLLCMPLTPNCYLNSICISLKRRIHLITGNPQRKYKGCIRSKSWHENCLKSILSKRMLLSYPIKMFKTSWTDSISDMSSRHFFYPYRRWVGTYQQVLYLDYVFFILYSWSNFPKY